MEVGAQTLDGRVNLDGVDMGVAAPICFRDVVTRAGTDDQHVVELAPPGEPFANLRIEAVQPGLCGGRERLVWDTVGGAKSWPSCDAP